MRLDEYQALRKRLGTASLINGLCVIAICILAPFKNMFLLAAATGLLVVCCVLVLKYTKQMERFRCPQCGKDPTTWISPGTHANEDSCCDYFTGHCLNCKEWLGNVN